MKTPVLCCVPVRFEFVLRHRVLRRAILEAFRKRVRGYCKKRTKAASERTLTCLMDEPVIPDTKASFASLYPSLIFAMNPGQEFVCEQLLTGSLQDVLNERFSPNDGLYDY